MTCKDAQPLLSDYFDELLDESKANEVAIHIATCKECYLIYKSFKKLFTLIGDLPYKLEPPSDLLPAIKEALQRIRKDDSKSSKKEPSLLGDQNKTLEEKQKLIKELQLTLAPLKKAKLEILTKIEFNEPDYETPSKKIPYKKILLGLTPVLLLTIFFIYQLTLINTPWRIDLTKGFYMINNIVINRTYLEKDEVITTQDSTILTITVPATGKITMFSNTSVQLVNGKSGDNSISFITGKILITSTFTLPDFIIIGKDFNIKDRGAIYTVEVNPFNNILIKVESGVVVLNKYSKSIYICGGYGCLIKPNSDRLIPFYLNTSEKKKSFISNFYKVNITDAEIKDFMHISNVLDALTLLELIRYASQSTKLELYDRVSNYFPLPRNVTKDGILQNNNEMLHLWWEEIQWQI